MASPRNQPSHERPPSYWALPKALARSAPGLVLEIFLKVSIAASFSVVVVSFFWGPPRTGLLAAANLAVNLVVLYRVRRGKPQGAPFVLALSLWALSSYAAWRGQGTHDVSVVVLGLLMMVAALLASRWQGAVVVGLTLAVVWAMGWAEMHGHSKSLLAHVTDYDDVFVLSIILLASATIMRVVMARLSQSLASAQASDRNYQEIFNATHEALIVLHADSGDVLDANTSATALLGRTLPRLPGNSFADVVGATNAEVQDWVAQCRAGQAVVQDRLLDPQVGGGLWIEMSLRLTFIDSQPRILAVIRDVHARHRLQEELRQADKLRALGHLAGGVAHDFNNQLTGILANAELLKLEAQRNRPINSAFVEAIIKCALRSADLTKQLLAFARKARPRREEVHVGALVKDVVDMLRRGLDPRVVVRVCITDTPLFAAADPSLLHNALLNLGINAKEAMPNGGELEFALSKVELTAEQARPLELAAGAYLEIQVRDTGTGMDAATKAQIFDPFFTTKDTGTGMGLAAAYGTVRGHGGALAVNSEPGRGSTFSVYLAASAGRAQATTESTKVALPLSRRKLVVWVVDDEPDVAYTTEHMLKALGHETRVFCSPQDAVDAFATHHADVSLCVLDRVMPGQSGDEVLGWLRKHNPQLPAVFVSGYSEDHTPEAPPANGTVFVQKPFGPKDLHQAISRLVPDQDVTVPSSIR